MRYLSEFKRLDLPWVLEVITEKFDFLPIDCMTDRSIVYGGAIRDVIAGIPLEGDLDISIPYKDLAIARESILSRSNWVELVDCPGGGKRISMEIPVSARMRLAPIRKYGNKDLPICKIISVQNERGAVVELISPSDDNGIVQAHPIDVVKAVDFRCCGLAMDRSGQVYEIVPGAYDDCKNRLLRFNREPANPIEYEKSKDRAIELSKRGWKVKANLKKLDKKYAKLLGEEKKATKAKKKAKPRYCLEELPVFNTSTNTVGYSAYINTGEAVKAKTAFRSAEDEYIPSRTEGHLPDECIEENIKMGKVQSQPDDPYQVWKTPVHHYKATPDMSKARERFTQREEPSIEELQDVMTRRKVELRSWRKESGKWKFEKMTKLASSS